MRARCKVTPTKSMPTLKAVVMRKSKRKYEPGWGWGWVRVRVGVRLGVRVRVGVGVGVRVRIEVRVGVRVRVTEGAEDDCDRLRECAQDVVGVPGQV